MSIRVALADDNGLMRRTVRELLVRMHVEVVEAASGRELLAMLDGEHFDAVVADVRMPDGGGIDVLRSRRACGDGTGFVVMTGAADDSVAAARSLAGTVVLMKPFSRDQLRAALTDLGVPLT
jgi:two-component system, NarL family, response regulator DevR